MIHYQSLRMPLENSAKQHRLLLDSVSFPVDTKISYSNACPRVGIICEKTSTTKGGTKSRSTHAEEVCVNEEQRQPHVLHTSVQSGRPPVREPAVSPGMPFLFNL